MSYSEDLRQRVVGFVAKGGSKREAARVFGIGRATIYRWLDRPTLAATPRLTRQRTINKQALSKHVQDYPEALLRERAIVFKVSPSGLWRAMRKMEFRKKNDALR